MHSLVDVLALLAKHRSHEKKCLELITDVSRQKCEHLETLIATETDPTKKKLLQAESDRLERKWNEAGAEFAKWNHWFSSAVEWCAQHTSVGSNFIGRLAIAQFDASLLSPDDQNLKPELPRLVEKLLELPVDIWQTKEWAKSVQSAQPKSDDRRQGGKVVETASSTAEELSCSGESQKLPPECEQLAYLAYDYARSKKENPNLCAKDAYDFWTDPELGLADEDREKFPRLVGYDPGKFSSFKSQLSRARNHPTIDDACYGCAKQKEKGRSIVTPEQI